MNLPQVCCCCCCCRHPRQRLLLLMAAAWPQKWGEQVHAACYRQQRRRLSLLPPPWQPPPYAAAAAAAAAAPLQTCPCTAYHRDARMPAGAMTRPSSAAACCCCPRPCCQCCGVPCCLPRPAPDATAARTACDAATRYHCEHQHWRPCQMVRSTADCGCGYGCRCGCASSSFGRAAAPPDARPLRPSAHDPAPQRKTGQTSCCRWGRHPQQGCGTCCCGCRLSGCRGDAHCCRHCCRRCGCCRCCCCVALRRHHNHHH